MAKNIDSQSRAHELALDARREALKKLAAGQKPTGREEAVMNKAAARGQHYLGKLS